MLKENVDYTLVPLQEGDDAWGVRFLTGDFVETVVSFGTVSFNEVKDCISFNFKLMSSPDPELTESNENLQDHCTRVLEVIIESGIEDGSVILNTREKE